MMNDLFLIKLEEIKKALTLELYNCALTLALTLPDICGKAEYPKECSSKQRYLKWFEHYGESYFTVPTTVLPSEEIIEYTWLSKEECWALRCSVLHAGNYDVDKVNLSNIVIHAHKRDGENYNHMVKGDNHVDWDVIQICETLCMAAEAYYLKNKDIFNISEIKIYTW